MRAVPVQNGVWAWASSGDESSFQRAKPQRLSVGPGCLFPHLPVWVVDAKRSKGNVQ